jgi:hypothetical protein
MAYLRDAVTDCGEKSLDFEIDSDTLRAIWVLAK